MANARFAKFVENSAKQNINYLTDTITVALMNGAAPDPASLSIESLQDLIDAGSSVVATETLASKTLNGADYGGADTVFTSVTGSVVNYAVMYKDTGTPATSLLFILIDTAAQLPITPNGRDIELQYQEGPGKIVSL